MGNTRHKGETVKAVGIQTQGRELQSGSVRENFKERVRFREAHKNEKGLDQLVSNHSQTTPGGS